MLPWRKVIRSIWILSLNIIGHNIFTNISQPMKSLLFIIVIVLIRDSFIKYKMSSSPKIKMLRPPDSIERFKKLYPAVQDTELLPQTWSVKEKHNFIGLSHGDIRSFYKGILKYYVVLNIILIFNLSYLDVNIFQY